MSLPEHLTTIKTGATGKPVIAFFDLDRTLVAGYTMTAFVYEQVRQGFLSARQVARQSYNYLQYGRERIGFDRLIGDAAQDFAGVPLLQAQAFARDVFERHIQPSIYREARALIAAHRQLGHRIVMITSATQFQAAPVAQALGIEHVCSTRLEVVRNVLTGQLSGKPCFGPGKASAGRRIARRFGVDLRDAWFYTDSADDLPLLEIVGNPVAVNAQAPLARIAQREGWPQIRFTSRSEPSMQDAMRTGMVCNALLASAAAGAAAWVQTRSAQQARNRMTRVFGDLGTAFAGLDMMISGQEHLEARRPAVFIFNHQSFVDALVLANLLRHDTTAFCKQELAATPVIGTLMRAAGAIFVDRDNPAEARAPLKHGMDALRDGRSVAVAPEGTRSASAQIAPFKHGAFLLARKAGVPLIPLVLHNTGDSMPRGSMMLHPVQVRVTVLEPLDVRSWAAREMGQRIHQVEDRYRTLLAD